MAGRVRSMFVGVGDAAMTMARQVGGITILFFQVLGALVPPRLDIRELFRNLHKMGNKSLPIIALTAFFTGGLMVVQSGIYVKQFNAARLVGWASGYAVFREVGPILIGLMFSGRVGANNTAELGTMTVTEQIDGLRALAIEPIRYLIAPRVIAMVISLLALTIIGNLIALGGGLLFSKLILNIEYSTFYYSLINNLKPEDFTHGLVKSVVFGLSIALTSCYYGITVRGGAVGVGRAVNAAVVSAAVSIMLLDFAVTYILG